MKTVPKTSRDAWLEYHSSRSPRLRDEIARQNDGLARCVASRMATQCSDPLEDLAQIARIGLIKAIEKFNPHAGAAFSSFAVPYIRGEIQHYLRDHFGSVKIPRRYFEDVAKVRKACRRLESEGIPHTVLQVAAAFGITPQRWTELEEATQRKQLANIDDHQFADESESPDHLHDHLRKSIAFLSSTKRAIVQDVWFKGLTVAQIASKRRITPQEVQSILDSALAQLKENLEGLIDE